MDSMLSCTELMKHAEHCGLGCTPTLNHTGELKAIFCSTSRWVSSSRNMSRESGRSEISALFAPADNRIHHAADQLPHGSFALAACSACRGNISTPRCWSPSATTPWALPRFPGGKLSGPFRCRSGRCGFPMSPCQTATILPSVNRRWNCNPAAGRVSFTQFPGFHSKPW